MPKSRLFLFCVFVLACGASFLLGYHMPKNAPTTAPSAHVASPSDASQASASESAPSAAADLSQAGAQSADGQKAEDAAEGPDDHGADSFVSQLTPEEQKEEEAEEEAAEEENQSGPVVYDENPRYTVERTPLGDVYRSTVLKGDRAEKILSEWLDPNGYTAVLAAAKPVYSLVSIRIGHAFSVTKDPETGDFKAFSYDVDKDHTLVVERNGDAYKARLEKIDYAVELVRVQGTITSTLTDAVVDMGEGISIAVALADIFASEINFITELREGDSFECLVEKRYLNKEFKGYGRIIGAWFTNRGNTRDAYLFYDENGRATYYNRRGENLHRALLKAPLPFLRVTSKYSMARRHPIYGVVRPHQGIDYGAPHGTPIMAVGNGVVTRVGRAGGYGNLVVIRHYNGLESMYAHMSRFAKGIRSGVKVRRGQTIGYVGSTGTATGPHLDFRIKQGGKFVNPSTLVVPRDKPLASRDRKRFNALTAEVDGLRNGSKDRASFNPDTWLDEGNS